VLLEAAFEPLSPYTLEYMHIYIYTRTHIRIYICMYTHKYAEWIRECCSRRHLNHRVYIHSNIYISIYIHTNVYKYTYVIIHKHIQKYMHNYTHKYAKWIIKCCWRRHLNHRVHIHSNIGICIYIHARIYKYT